MKNLLSILFLLAFSAQIQAQIYNPVKWKFSKEKVNSSEYILKATATIDAGWHIYSQFLESGDGPVATEFEFESGSFELVGKTEEVGKRKEGYDKMFGMNLIKFYNKVEFKQRIKVKDGKKPVEGYLTFMTCNDDRCLPPTDVDFTFELD